jgi:hypothetical protein
LAFGFHNSDIKIPAAYQETGVKNLFNLGRPWRYLILQWEFAQHGAKANSGDKSEQITCTYLPLVFASNFITFCMNTNKTFNTESKASGAQAFPSIGLYVK